MEEQAREGYIAHARRVEGEGTGLRRAWPDPATHDNALPRPRDHLTRKGKRLTCVLRRATVEEQYLVWYVNSSTPPFGPSNHGSSQRPVYGLFNQAVSPGQSREAGSQLSDG